MTDTQNEAHSASPQSDKKLTTREWMKILISYREPFMWRSIFEVFVTVIPLMLLCYIAYLLLQISYFLSLPFCVAAGCFLVRLFIIQHDCGHGSYFKSKNLNNWLGRILGVFTLTPYTLWKRAHAIHHSSAGNLDKRGVGDINTLTVAEYMALGATGRFKYRLYRHPIVMFGIGPIFIFMLHYRLPIGFMNAGIKYWISSLGTSLSMLICGAIMVHFVGLGPFLMIYLPTVIVAGTLGVWMFYVQHQFEDTVWEYNGEWQMQDAALEGSSYYDLPGFLPWLTGYIGIHHVHHLNSRIPFYRLKKVLRDHAALANMKRITLWESFKCVKLQLWCEQKKKLISFKEAVATQTEVALKKKLNA
ncbi:MAG: fatty acid desaturase [Robiginitomaculum sp.]|nr:MAG: fatty acid desaturase [Robiginitomaculum sp.]